MRGTVEERFAAKVVETPGRLPTPCWMWSGYTDRAGYGSFTIAKSKMESAHRASWKLHRGAIPDGQCVLHECDTPGCVNPSHLFLGTQLENISDREKKGRGVRPKGEGHGCAKLTEAYVLEARAMSKTVKQVMAETGLSFTPAWTMLTRRTWKHLP